MVVPFFFISGKGQDIERLKRGGCYEREKQRSKGKQEGPTEKPQREEKDEEGEEEQVITGCRSQNAESRFKKLGTSPKLPKVVKIWEVSLVHIP